MFSDRVINLLQDFLTQNEFLWSLFFDLLHNRIRVTALRRVRVMAVKKHPLRAVQQPSKRTSKERPRNHWPNALASKIARINNQACPGRTGCTFLFARPIPWRRLSHL